MRPSCAPPTSLHRDNTISDATWSALGKHYNTQQLMDVVITTVGYRMVSMAPNTLGVQCGSRRPGIPAAAGSGVAARPLQATFLLRAVFTNLESSTGAFTWTSFISYTRIDSRGPFTVQREGILTPLTGQ